MGAEAFSTLQTTSDTYNRYDFQKKDRERRKEKVIHIWNKKLFLLELKFTQLLLLHRKHIEILFHYLSKTHQDFSWSLCQHSYIFILFFFFDLKLWIASEKCSSWHTYTARDPQNNHSSVSIAMTKQWMLQTFYETKMWSSVAINSVLLWLLKSFAFLCKWSVFHTHRYLSIFRFCHLL